MHEAVIDKKAIDPCVLELKGISDFTDYFFICSVESSQQMRAVAEGIQEKLKSVGVKMIHQEGKWGSAWILLDYGELIVHIFDQEARQFYDLEELWQNASRLEF